MTVLQLLYISAFGMWILLSAVWQFEGLRHKVLGRDLIWKFRLLPIYTFFAPNPGIYDYRIVYRYKFDDGSLGNWRELHHLTMRQWSHFFWNPRKRIQKLIADSIMSVKESINSTTNISELDHSLKSAIVRLSQGYVALFNIAKSFRKEIGATHFQFMIAETTQVTGSREVNPIFKSPFHVLG